MDTPTPARRVGVVPGTRRVRREPPGHAFRQLRNRHHRQRRRTNMQVEGAVCDPLLSTRAVTFTKAQIADYAAASGDHNPIHLDDEFAKSVGLPGVIAHGLI